LNPKAHSAWTFAGICLVRLGKLKEGLIQLQRAEQLGAHGAVLFEAQGDAHYHLKNFREARSRYQRARENGGHSSVIESKLGVCEVRLGRKDEGLRHIQHAIECEPAVAELHDILTATAAWLGDLKLAAESAERRLFVGKSSPENFVHAARIWGQRGDWQRAGEILQRGLERFPSAEMLRQAIAEVTTRSRL
jgi:tetratricopeptide (TPR) repeat protein